MKDYREMADNVLRRRDAYRMKQKKNKRIVVSVLSCFCAAVVLGFGGWYSGILTGDDLKQVKDMQPKDIVIADISNEINRPEAEQKTGKETQRVTKRSSITDLSADKNGENMTESEESGRNNDSSSRPAGNETAIDVPVSDIPGDTGALTAYDEVWGGSYMDENGRWVVWLTEDTPENRQTVFRLNPVLDEDNTVFKAAKYSKAYLTDLMARISSAMSAGKLPFVTTAALREDKNCVEVTTIFDDPASTNQILAFDTLGGGVLDGAIEIKYDPEGHVILDLIKDPEEP